MTSIVRNLAPYVYAIYNQTTHRLVIERYSVDPYESPIIDECYFPSSDNASALIKFLQQLTSIEVQELGKMLPGIEKILLLL
jgi:hypothetical protein